MKSRIPASHRRARREPPIVADDGSPIADGVTLHIGDARAVLPTLALDRDRTVVITDPPWPEAPADLLTTWGVDDCAALVAEVLALCAERARRLVIVLGCSTDPRLVVVPRSMPFVRVCWLRLALPSPRGTILNSGDVAYVFGSHESAEGMTLLPGECTASTPRAREDEGAQMHPTARRLEHMRFLVRHFTRGGGYRA